MIYRLFLSLNHYQLSKCNESINTQLTMAPFAPPWLQVPSMDWVPRRRLPGEPDGWAWQYPLADDTGIVKDGRYG